MNRTRRTWPYHRERRSTGRWHCCRPSPGPAFAPRRHPSATRARCADNDDDRSAAWRDGPRDAHERAALRRDETLLKPERLKRRMPPNTMPAQRHEATGETHTTEPYSTLCDTPNSHRLVEEPTFVLLMRVAVWREQDLMRQCGIDLGVIPRSFHDEKMCPASLQPRALTAFFGTGSREGTSNAPRRNERQCPPLFRGGRQRNTDHLPARVRGRPHQLGTADALLLALAPLHCLFRARLHAVGCAAVIRGLHLQTFLFRRACRARSPEDPEGAFHRPVDGLLFVAADRPERAGARAVVDAGRRRLRFGPRQSRRLPQAMPGQWRAVREDRR